MADIPVDGKTRVAFVDAIADQAAPSVSELTGGLDLTFKVTRDGLMGLEPTTGEIDASSLGSTFDTKSIGISEFSGTGLRLKKQDGTDTVYNTLIRGKTGFLVVRRYIAATTAWASGQAVGVYPVICGETKELSPEKNTMARYEVPMMVSEAPTLRASVA